MTEIHKSTVVKASSRQMSADLAGEKVLLNYGDGVYYSLNTVGARIWELVQDATSVESLLTQLLSEYDAEPAECEADLVHLLDELSGLGLVELRNGTAP